MAKRLTIFLLAFLFVSPLSAAEKHVPAIDDLINLEKPASPQISPDGHFVAYTVREANWTDNSFEYQIWLANTQTGEVIRLTNSKKANTSPAWSPDGRSLGFISDRNGGRQIYVISPSGGEARQVTKAETGVLQFRWSPDGDRIAFTMPDPETKEMKDRRDKYSDFEMVRHDYTTTHLWVVDLHDGDTRRLTQGSQYTIGSFSWAPDGERLAFDAQVNPTLTAGVTANIYIYSFNSHSVRRLIDEPGPDRNPAWSPDGEKIIFETGMGRANFFYENLCLGIIPAEGGTVSNITGGFDEHASFTAWAPDGIYFTAAQKTAAHLFRVDLKTLAIKRVSPQENAAYSSFTFTKDFKSVAFIEADSTHYPEIYVSSVKSFAPQKLTDYAAQLRDFRLATREIISWKNADGTTIEGALMKPADFDPGKKHPLLVVIHGGPAAVSQAIPALDTSYYPQEIWAAKGALILEPNYRGSDGYGENFHRLTVRTLGSGDYDDVISGVDYLIAKGWVDKDRVGAMGWSFGGFISAFIATNSDRFKAISVGAGPTDWQIFDTGTDLQQITRRYLASTPWDDPEIYRKSSPITNIKHAITPTMIQHCGLDPIVPISSAYELYQGLLDQGVPVRFYVYKGFGHNVTKPKSIRAVAEHNLNWFNHYIWGDPDADGPK